MEREKYRSFGRLNIPQRRAPQRLLVNLRN